VLKQIILVREEKQLRKLEREYKRYEDVDGSGGACCCNCIENQAGVNCILWLDLIFIVNLPRFWVALLVKRNGDLSFGMYNKVRFATWIIETVLACIGLIAFVFYQTMYNK
jgi:hypothetical protein